MEKPHELEFGSKILPKTELFEEQKVIQEDANNYDINGLVLGSTNPSLGTVDLKVEEEDGKRSINSVEYSSLTYNSIQSESECSSFSISDDAASPKDSLQSEESPECSISDDEGLFEIALSDGHCVAPKDSNEFFIQSPPEMKSGSLPGFLPETVFRQHGLMEVLSEINEEDNLIEIDITRGSIKCSRLEIKA